MEASSTPGRVGLWRTLAWMALLGVYLASLKTDLLDLRPNEFGDFLAGVFAPLAFIWIIVAYLQQASELRLQVAELTAQVQATRSLADAAASDARRATAQAQPAFHSAGVTRSGPAWTLRLQITGPHISDVLLGEVQGELRLAAFSRPVWSPGERVVLNVVKGGRGFFEMRYRDLHHEEQSQWIYFDGTARLMALGYGGHPRELQGLLEPEDGEVGGPGPTGSGL